MALSTELYGLQSAGVYRFEKDATVAQNTVEPLNNIRMLVGFSKIGPFNTPVYIASTKEFTDTFGPIDRNLEKKGAFFHRSCLAALSAGPIYALNLLKLNPETDYVDVMKFSPSATCGAQSYILDTSVEGRTGAPYVGMYNIDTFYTPSEESFLYTIGRNNTFITSDESADTNCLLNFTNIGKTPVSVIVTKASDYNASAYNVTAQEWYGKGNVPEYLKDTSYISDFMVDVYVLSGDWGRKYGDDPDFHPYTRFASDIKFNKYFDKDGGLIRRKNDDDTSDTLLTQFLNEPDVQLIGKYTGCLIPDFIDKNGHNLYIEYLINSDTSVNGLMCSVNERVFDGTTVIDGDKNGIDMIGHNLPDEFFDSPNGVPVEFLSYRGELAYTDTVTNVGVATSIQVSDSNELYARPNEFFIPVNTSEDYSCIKVGNYIASMDSSDNSKTRLTRIVNITGVTNSEGIIEYRRVSCQDNVLIDNDSVDVYPKLTDLFKCYDIYTFNGFKMTASHMPDGTNEKQAEILNLLTEESTDCNLYNALIDRELIQFRYLVDTFGLGIEEQCKSQYTRLCQGRKSAFAIINAPSVNDFKNSEDPSFVDKNKAVSAEFIAKGGDPEMNPSFLFSLPDKPHGSTWGAYYYPYLKVYSNYATINVPPAAYVSNNYVAKYGAGSPWTLVAGQSRGVISGNNVVGVETSLIRENRNWLEPFGINAIIYQNDTGCVIYANKTAQQKPQSALSSINCREACIYIQDGIEKILRNYLFETNTAQTRLEIKTLVDNFLDTVKNNGGVYDYKTVMDSSNNTNEVIDHNMGVIDVFIEPVRGLEILVQTLTVLRTGAIESGSFE